MPNWKMTGTMRDEIEHKITELMDRRMISASSGFPLTHDQVQFGIMDPSYVKTLRSLVACGIEGIRNQSRVEFGLTSKCHGVARLTSVGIRAEASGGFFTMKAYPDTVSVTYSRRMIGTRFAPVFRADLLDEATLTTLAKWADGIVRELRLAEITNYMTKEIYEYTPTVAHLTARWPTLATLFISDENRLRAQSLPKRDQYGWGFGPVPPVNWLAQREKLIKAADQALVGAMLMPACKKQYSEQSSFVTGWQARPTDWKPGDLPAIAKPELAP